MVVLGKKGTMKENKISIKEIIKTLVRLYSMVKKYWQYGIIRWLGGIFSAALGVISGWIMGQTLDVALSGDMDRFYQFLIYVSIFVVARGTINFVNPYFGNKFIVKAGNHLSKLCIEKINNLKLNYYEDKHTGDTISVLVSDIDKLSNFFSNFIAGAVSFIPTMFIFGLILSLKMSWELTLIASAIVPFIGWIMMKMSKPIKEASTNLQEATAKYNSYLRDFAEGVITYKSFNMSKIHGKKFDESCGKINEENIKISRQRALLNVLGFLGFFLPELVVYGFGGMFIMQGKMTIGEVFAFSYIFGRVRGIIRRIPSDYSQLLVDMGIAKRVLDVLDTANERKDGTDFYDKNQKNVLSMSNVEYSYVKGIAVLSNISFKVEKGSKTALVGISGSGKSTINKLFLGFYENYKGEIKICNRNLREWNLEALRKHIAVVNQEVYLFNSTIMENIRYGNIKASDNAVIEAAKKAYADEFIMDTKEGYNTILGERGMNLSGGQRQRIAIARAMLKDAPILLLDEPTSALDTKAEYYVKLALERLEEGKTVFVIAHRLSTIENSDKIILIEEGRVIEEGSHDVLIESGGRYSDMYLRQVALKET